MSLINRLGKRITLPSIQQSGLATSAEIHALQQQMEQLAILQGRTLALENAARAPLSRLQDAEFKVFSQFGEDGILQYLIRETKISQQETSFVEFGVQNYTESNTRFLLMNDNWRGLIIDGSQANMERVRKQDFYWRYDLTAVDAWIDRDNINQLIGDAGFSGDIGILSIDIDGNDYWVWERINIVRPVIVVVEWNSLFGASSSVSVPYDPAFQRSTAHFSHLYYGASISAFHHLAAHKGYALIGSNTAGNNLFFVRHDRMGSLVPQSPADAYVESRFRDSRNENGELNFLRGDNRTKEIFDLPLVKVVSGESTTLRKLHEQEN